MGEVVPQAKQANEEAKNSVVVPVDADMGKDSILITSSDASWFTPKRYPFFFNMKFMNFDVFYVFFFIWVIIKLKTLLSYKLGFFSFRRIDTRLFFYKKKL